MKVKIIKANDKSCWYNDRIGEEFEVVESITSYQYVTSNGWGIRKEDCSTVPINNPIQPSHYNAGEFDVIAFCQQHGLGFCEGNIIKYVVRAGRKDATKTVEDLLKAKEYLDRHIAHHERDRKTTTDNAS